jgi:hypothetical protein
MIVQDIHVNSLSPAICESFLVILVLDMLPNAGNNHCTRVDSLKITSRHLEYNTSRCWHSSNNSSSAFDTTASLILFWVVWWNFKIFFELA